MSTHYVLQKYHGDYDLNLVTDAGARIRTDAVFYDGELARRVLAFLEAHATEQPIKYNAYTAYRRNIGDPLNGARLAFHDFAGPDPRTVEDWDNAWHEFICADARDERATLQDALV